MQGTQSRLNFLPEKHTDFIFTVLAEEFGFVGAVSLLALYTLIVGFCLYSALTNRDRFARLITIGISGTFFLCFGAIDIGHGDGNAAGQGLALAVGQLWRNLADDPSAGLRPCPICPCPPAKIARCRFLSPLRMPCGTIGSRH